MNSQLYYLKASKITDGTDPVLRVHLSVLVTLLDNSTLPLYVRDELFGDILLELQREEEEMSDVDRTPLPVIVRQRWCRRGDTISTVRSMTNQHLHETCLTAESCAEANELIATGSWLVSRCGHCGTTIEECQCD